MTDTTTKTAAIEIKFWWIPQVPMKAFERLVATVSMGRELENAFADYDLFQHANDVKPDYCNAGGVVYRHSDLTDGDWYDVPDGGDELSELVADAVKLGIDPSPLA